jgi:alginate O-acetyltransferase complex protein AlgI
MLFNSILFLFFLPIVFIGFWLIPLKFRNFFLLIASYFFYFSYNPWFLLLLIGTSVIDFKIASLISNNENKKHRKLYLIISITSNIIVLFVFKYFVFFYNSFNLFFNSEFSLITSFIIPAGLSFYTFQSLSYIIDVYRNKHKADDTLFDFLLYVSFFPHMVAGPIVRHEQLMPQIKSNKFFKEIEWENACKLIIWGFFKKIVIADNISRIINPVFNTLPNYLNSLDLIIAGVLFLIQLYTDFSGYSDIASGVAKLFKIDLIINWNRPLLSTSIREYWKRHHISLTNWFKEYLYFTLGGNKVTIQRWIFNVFIVFLLSGFWHGANFTFLIWGILNCLFYLIEFIPFLNRIKIHKIIKWIYTLIIVSILFISFRANSMGDLISIYDRIFVEFSIKNGILGLLKIHDRIFFYIIIFMILILFIKEIQQEFMFLKSNKIYNSKLISFFYMFILFLIIAFGNFDSNSFIYFQF